MPSIPGGLSWDPQDRLQSTDHQGGGVTYYVYDSAGLRVRKVHRGQAATTSKERFYLGPWETYRETSDLLGTPTLDLERETLHVHDPAAAASAPPPSSSARTPRSSPTRSSPLRLQRIAAAYVASRPSQATTKRVAVMLTSLRCLLSTIAFSAGCTPIADRIPVRGPTSNGTYFLDKYEVSVSDYRACVRRGACSPPYPGRGREWRKLCTYFRSLPRAHEYPVDCVSVRQAQEYCKWRGGRLPTLDEWRWRQPGTVRDGPIRGASDLSPIATERPHTLEKAEHVRILGWSLLTACPWARVLEGRFTCMGTSTNGYQRREGSRLLEWPSTIQPRLTKSTSTPSQKEGFRFRRRQATSPLDFDAHTARNSASAALASEAPGGFSLASGCPASSLAFEHPACR
ncbi:MAG: SUMF1/EgtB/PvdO family nonheme iron enzyme [Myxococcales bacterium]|nr:SUMF1/EgtB/PvdO family nonheme iron enzyme [Myxococcales bacterium]